MVSNIRTLISLLIVFCLITACKSADSGVRKTTLSTSTIHTLASLMQPAKLLGPTFTSLDIQHLYGIDSLLQRGFTGQGQTVIVFALSSNPTLQQDMNIFDQKFNLPSVDLQVIPPNPVPEDPPSWADTTHLETQMDVEAVHTMAPGAKIIVLQLPEELTGPAATPPANCSQDIESQQEYIGVEKLFQQVSYTIDHQLGYIISFSGGAYTEWFIERHCLLQQLQPWNSFLQQAATQHHITFFFPSDDVGGTVTFYADSPWVVGVGGTTIQPVGSTFQETAWTGSGGGFSDFPMPSYQKVLPPMTWKQFYVFNPRRITTPQMLQVINQRGIPDVSAMASYPPIAIPGGTRLQGFPVYVSGKLHIIGGTSLSTPLWAGIQAIANQMAGHPLGFINPGLYKLAISPTYHQDFHDITTGNNTIFSATPGWDPATGLGTPNAEKLIPDLIAAMK